MAPFGHLLDGFSEKYVKIRGFRGSYDAWSITTGESSYAPPALIASALIDFGKAMPVV
jgi:hypothetical protein